MKKLLCVGGGLLVALAAALLVNGLGVLDGAAAKTPGVDLDLTRLSSTMAYAALTNVVTDPNPYLGKMIKIKGQFDAFRDRDGNFYCGVTVTDPTACCASGLDCLFKSKYEYPKDYPEPGSDVTVAGRFAIHQDGKKSVYRLVDADLL